MEGTKKCVFTTFFGVCPLLFNPHLFFLTFYENPYPAKLNISLWNINFPIIHFTKTVESFFGNEIVFLGVVKIHSTFFHFCGGNWRIFFPIYEHKRMKKHFCGGKISIKERVVFLNRKTKFIRRYFLSSCFLRRRDKAEIPSRRINK